MRFFSYSEEMTSDLLILGKRIRHFRVQSGMTLEALGEPWALYPASFP
jgi:hypothetical protein